MEKNLLIIQTMTRYSISFNEASILVSSIFKQGKEKEFLEFLEKFPTYSEILQKYGGKK